MRNYFLGLCLLFALCFTACSHSDDSVDVLIIGGGASGVTAGIQSARMGAATLIVEETEWLGGMLTSAGVSAVDGNYDLPAGLFGEFREHLADYYGGLDSLKTGWVSAVLFEPSVGNKIFHEMVDAEKNLKVWHNATLVKLEREKDVWIAQIQMKDNTIKKIHAKILIDGTELGDIAKMCGVKYDVGMESRHDTKEDIAPEEKNNIVQDITYVAILKDYGKDVTIPCPEGYNKDEFACACASHVCITPKEPDRVWSKDMMITYGKLPNNKYMINWPIEGNDYYVNLIEMTREEREEALKYAKHYTMCFVYFLQHELGFNTLGLADDEYPTADKLPFIPYHRESRRIHGLVRFDLNHACEPFRQSQPLYRTCIAVGNYPVDHHHTRYHGYEELPNLYFHPIPSYGLPLGTLIPKDVEGLIVAEKSISVSNIINGTTRLQPMVMQIGQAAGALAALAVKEGKNIREVSVREVQNAILDGKGYLLPYYDSGKYWDTGDMTWEVEDNKYVIDEVWENYGSKYKSFGGWYISGEISRATKGAIGAFHALGKQCKDISNGLPTFISPWIDGKKAIMGTTKMTKEDAVSVQQHEKEWDEIFDGIHDVVDACAFQDGHIDYDELDAFFSVNKKLADKYGMQCWTNAESFDRDMPIRFLPIKFDKLRMKLEAAKRAGYDKAITFEFSHFMSPQSAYLQAGHLYDRYKEYFEIK